MRSVYLKKWRTKKRRLRSTDVSRRIPTHQTRDLFFLFSFFLTTPTGSLGLSPSTLIRSRTSFLFRKKKIKWVGLPLERDSTEIQPSHGDVVRRKNRGETYFGRTENPDRVWGRTNVSKRKETGRSWKKGDTLHRLRSSILKSYTSVHGSTLGSREWMNHTLEPVESREIRSHESWYFTLTVVITKRVSFLDFSRLFMYFYTNPSIVPQTVFHSYLTYKYMSKKESYL